VVSKLSVGLILALPHQYKQRGIKMNESNITKELEVQPELDEGKIEVDLEELFSANMHFGYKTKYRNPWMSDFIFESKNNIDIIDLTKTVVKFNKALVALRKCVSRGGRVLFVGTEAHTAGLIKNHAEMCAQYFINKRWLGGLLTNWRNTCDSISIMRNLDHQIEGGYLKNFKKKEQTRIIKKQDRFKRFLNGIKDMGALPNMVIIASNRERNAIKEAIKLNIPVVLLMDTNTNPEGIQHGIPGNDRSMKAVDKFLSKCATACLLGVKEEMRTIAHEAKANPDAKSNAPEAKPEAVKVSNPNELNKT
jgi:small subunit ribosomal protein S2